MSYFGFFSFRIGMFFQESRSPEYALFSLLFSGLYPPPRNKIRSFLCCYIVYFHFPFFWIRLIVRFSFVLWFILLFLQAFSLSLRKRFFVFFSSYMNLSLYDPTCFYFHFFLSNMHLYCADLRRGIPADSPLFQAFQRFRRRMPVPVVFARQEIRTSSGCAKSSSASPVALDAPWCPASRMVQRRGFCAAGWVDGAARECLLLRSGLG